MKPGYALNELVPRKKALFATDYRVEEVIKGINVILFFE